MFYRIALLFTLITVRVFAQQIPMGSWQVHLAYNKGSDVAVAKGKVYCVANGNLFSYNTSDNQLQRLSKVNGLSDIDVSCIEYDPTTDQLLVAYTNANIDLLQNDKVVNIPDVKRKQLFGDKKIYNAYIENGAAYLACGFGIIKLDLAKQEIKETYNLTLSETPIAVNDITTDGEKIYAATNTGVYYGMLNSIAITNGTGWKKYSTLPFAAYNTIDFYNGKILVNKVGGVSDSLYSLAKGDTTWALQFTDFTEKCMGINHNTAQNLLAISYRNFVRLFDQNYNLLGTVFNYPNENIKESAPMQCDFDSVNNLWIADGNNGMVKNRAMLINEKIQPAGPYTNQTFRVSMQNKNLWVTSGGYTDSYNNLFNIQGISNFYENEWKSVLYNYATSDSMVVDVIDVLAHPSQPTKAYAAGWGNGLLEIESGKVVKTYNNRNSILRSRPEYEWVGIGGLAFDANENLWLTNSYTSNFIAVLTPDNKLTSFNVASVIGPNSTASQIIISSLGYKWCRLARGGGILVFDESGTIDDPTDDKMVHASIGSFVGSEIFCMAEDRNETMWVGTDKGINVIYNTSGVFEGISSQQIKVEQDGYVQYLLETETVTAIAVDGGNRKWIGTSGSGVYLLSEDGTEQLLHFTKENSPLLSNEINSIVINNESGEVFFGTAVGIISYRSDASEPKENLKNVYAFPNPVKPNYTGVVSIVGLVENTDIKITDAAGNLVFSGKSQGGTAIWDAKNTSSERVKSGVYIVLCTNEDGSQKTVTKIVVLN